MSSQLVGMGVKPFNGHVKDPRTDVGIDELSRQFKMIRKRARGIRNFGLVVLANFLEPAAAGVRIGRRPLHKIEEVSVTRLLFDNALDKFPLLLLVCAAQGGDTQLKVFEGIDSRNPVGSTGEGKG